MVELNVLQDHMPFIQRERVLRWQQKKHERTKQSSKCRASVCSMGWFPVLKIRRQASMNALHFMPAGFVLASAMWSQYRGSIKTTKNASCSSLR